MTAKAIHRWGCPGHVLSIAWTVVFFSAFRLAAAPVSAAFGAHPPQHPRLVFTRSVEAELRARLQSNQRARDLWEAIRAEAGTMLVVAPAERIQTGRRLLGVSRLVLKRVVYLSMAYRLTGDRRFLDRAEQEMLAAASFGDWNPSHFLDVGEMTLALAIGYDWLDTDLPKTSRVRIQRAIIEKGLQPSFEARYSGWARGRNNWNQVCNAGMTYGALAIWEDEPALAKRVVERAVESVRLPMEEYAPDGAYPEGPGYWEYGTSFNVLLIAALESVLGSDFGLAAAPGFPTTSMYYLQMIGPSGQYYNYSDCGRWRRVSAAMHWFASRLGDPSLLWEEQKLLAEYVTAARENPGSAGGDRLLPFALLWAGSPLEAQQPTVRHWLGLGATPVAIHRSSWSEASPVFLGIKGGSPAGPHAHMDIGSFVLEADGVRWAMDLGAQDYHSLESRGLSLWDRQQQSDRWRVFRYSNLGHGTLVVNGQLQVAKGVARVVSFSGDPADAHTVIDMSEVYAGQCRQAWRGVRLLPSGQVWVQDDLELAAPGGVVRWTLVTPAEVEAGRPGKAVLRAEGQALDLEVLEPKGVPIRTYSTEGPAGHDAPNPGTRLVGFEVDLPPGQPSRLAVLLTPGGRSVDRETLPPLVPLSTWSKPLE